MFNNNLVSNYSNNNIYLFNNDCFEILKDIKDNTVDLFLLDLPYGQTSCKWDSLINMEEMWKEIKRIMKAKAHIIFFTTTKFGYAIINSNPKWFRYDLIWKKSKKVGFLSANKQPLRQHELIYIFSDNKQTNKLYNPQMEKGKPYKSKGGGNITGYYRDGKVYKSKEINNEGTRYPASILEFNNPKKSYHKTGKPVDLIEWLIKTYSNENDLVCDFTMGSASTGIACINTKRKFIGIELNKDIYKIAEDRIKEKLEDNEE